MIGPRRCHRALLAVALVLGLTGTGRADPIEPFVQVEVNGQVHRVVAVPDPAFCSALDCVAGVVELQLDAGSLRVVGVLHQGVDPLAPQYGHNHGQWSVRLYVEATNMSPEPLSIIASAGTPISPLFLFPTCCELIEAHDGYYYHVLDGVLTPGPGGPDTVTLDPLFPDFDGDGIPEMFSAFAASSSSSPLQNLGVDIGAAVTGKGLLGVFPWPLDIVHIDPSWVFLQSTLAFTMSGNGDEVRLRGDILIQPTPAPEPSLLGLLGLGLGAIAFRGRTARRGVIGRRSPRPAAAH